MLRVLALSVFPLLCLDGLAADCSLAGEAAEERLVATPTCKPAVELLSDCALGQSGDIVRAAITREKCERSFVGSLGIAQLRICRHDPAYLGGERV